MGKQMIAERCMHCRGPVCIHEKWIATNGGVAHSECDVASKSNTGNTGVFRVNLESNPKRAKLIA